MSLEFIVIIVLFALAHIITIYMIYDLGARMTEMQNKQYTGMVNVSNKILDLLSITNAYLEKLSNNSPSPLRSLTPNITPTLKQKENFRKRAH